MRPACLLAVRREPLDPNAAVWDRRAAGLTGRAELPPDVRSFFFGPRLDESEATTLAGPYCSSRGTAMAGKHNPGRGRQSPPAPIEIANDVAHPARVYDYVRGGDDNFNADREVADFAAAAGSGGLDHARAAVQANEAFHNRAVAYLAGDAGIRQFLEIGTGIPTEGNTHQIAQGIAPESRVVYTDDDPVVLAHAHTLRKSAPPGATAYVSANPRDPDTILRQAATVLDLGQPIAVVIVAILYHIE